MKGIYIVGGYPDKEKFIECFKAVSDSGYDFIEVSIPFNDPVADGPVIAGAINEAVESGVTPGGLLELFKSLSNIKIKKYIMTYGNIVYSYGIKKFSDNYKDLIDGIIIADLPNRETGLFIDNGFEIPIVPFATLETRKEDIERMNKSKSEFIYFVGLRGITGSKADFTADEFLQKIEMIKKYSDKKVMIGFGIKTAEDVKQALSAGDGFVIGTEAVKRQKNPSEFKKYISSVLS